MSEDKNQIESMRCMATDTLGEDAIDMPLSEFAKAFRAKPENEASKPLLIYHREDKWAWLKRLPKLTVTPNPNATYDLIERLHNREEMIDLYTEREMRAKGQTPTIDLEAQQALEASDLINTYEEKRLQRLQMQRRQ